MSPMVANVSIVQYYIFMLYISVVGEVFSSYIASNAEKFSGKFVYE